MGMKKTILRVVLLLAVGIGVAIYLCRDGIKQHMPQYIEEQLTYVEEQLETLNSCEVDDDCELVYAPCPFGCRKVVNRQFVTQATELMESYRTQQAEL